MAGGELTHPGNGTNFERLRLYLKLTFYPAIKLTRKNGFLFAESISDYLEAEKAELTPSEWKYFGGGNCEELGLTISPNSIALEAQIPPKNLEWYEHRFEPILEAFKSKFFPGIVLHCKIITAALVTIPKLDGIPDGIDAMRFLAENVMLLDPKQLASFNRPLYTLGFKFSFPPYETDDDSDESQVNWGVDVRIESAATDSKKIFLEADADWHSPKQWEQDSGKEAVGRLELVSDFMSDKLVKFLQQPRSPSDED